jgi:outer membrane biosynthesis protein TonB
LPCGLEAEAKNAVKNAKFRAARRGDRAIDSLLSVPVRFEKPTGVNAPSRGRDD